MLTLILSLLYTIRVEVALAPGLLIEEDWFGPLEIASVNGEPGLVGEPGLASGLDHSGRY